MRNLILYFRVVTPLLFVFVICELHSQSQVSEDFYSNEIDRYISIKFDNDTYYYTDYYYTNGIEIELKLPVISQFSRTQIFSKVSKKSLLETSISFAHRLYTPKNIRDTTIQFNDRPFAATLEVDYINSITGLNSGFDFLSRIRLGFMGPAAGGKAFHKKIHEWINSPDPKGWDYQIANDIILNYDFTVFYPILKKSKIIIAPNGTIRAGTLYDDLSMGLTFAFGSNSDKLYINNTLPAKSRKIKFFIVTDVNLKYVIYNATLQGGLFSRNDPYVIKYSQLTPIVFSANVILGINWHGISLSLGHNFLTREFATGTSHNYASILLGFKF